MAWTVRLRFRVSKPLTSDDSKLALKIGGHEVTISTSDNSPLKQSNWLTLNAHDLESESEAWGFGRRIVDALLLAGIRREVGIDMGENDATTRFSKTVTDGYAKIGKRLMPNVHGILVYERTGNETFIQVSATASVTESPSVFFDQVGSCFDEMAELDERERTALTLISLSKLAREPLAEAALCISAVEYLSADASWTPAQVKLLGELKFYAASSVDLPENEAREVADGIERIFKSIRQSIKRKIRSLDLPNNDWKLFDEVYSLRSGIFHGSIVGRTRHVELASKAREICARIVLAAEQRARVGKGVC